MAERTSETAAGSSNGTNKTLAKTLLGHTLTTTLIGRHTLGNRTHWNTHTHTHLATTVIGTHTQTHQATTIIATQAHTHTWQSH